MTKLLRVLTLRDVVLFNIIAVFGLRGMATAAKMGAVAIPLWLVAIAAFLIPHALSTAEMATADPGEGGIYRWTRDAFGSAHGFLAGWFYWISNITFLVTALTTFVGYTAYAIHRNDLGESASFVTVLGLVLLWTAAWSNVRGLQVARWVSNLGAISIWIAAMMLIGVSIVAAIRFGSATPLAPRSMIDGLSDWSAFGYFGTLSFALCGLELVAGMGDEVKSPERTFPRAIVVASAVIAVLYFTGTAAVLVAQTADEVSPISGAIGSLELSANRLGWPIVGTLGAILVAFATGAGAFTWLGGVARLPFAAGVDRFIPPAFAKLHPRYGTPYVAIYVQAGLVTLCLLAAELGSTVRGAFLLMVSMTIVMGFVPYIYAFLAVPVLRRRTQGKPGVARIPFGRFGLWSVTILGTLTTVATIISSVTPTPDVGSALVFEVKVWGGLLLFGALGFWVYRRNAGARGSDA